MIWCCFVVIGVVAVVAVQLFCCSAVVAVAVVAVQLLFFG